MGIMLTEKQTMANLSVYQPSPSSAQDFLDIVASPSKAAFWQLDYWVIACCAYAMDLNLDMQLIEMEKVAAKSRYGTLPWYVQMAKDFQYGDALVLDDLQWKYAVINPSNRIIKLAAAQEGDGRVNLKIATIVGTTSQPVTTPQFNALKVYFESYKKPPGIRLNIINDNPDDLILHVTANYNPLELTATGELISSPGTFPIVDAMALYLNSLDFNGIYELQTQQDYMQKAPGMKTAYITFASARYGANPFIQFNERYLPNAGYLKMHSSTIITYIASV